MPQQPPSGHFGPAPAHPIDGISDDAPPLLESSPSPRRLPLEKTAPALPPVPEPVETKRQGPSPSIPSLRLGRRTGAQAAASPPAQAAPSGLPYSGPVTLEGLLAAARAAGASDLHLSAAQPCAVRIGNELRAVAIHAPTVDEVRQMLMPLLREDQMEVYRISGSFDVIHEMPDGARSRVHFFGEQRGMAASFRMIPAVLPTVDELGLGTVADMLSTGGGGLILVAGAPRSGKSTTVASLVAHLNRTRAGHVITIEDLVEVVHVSEQGLIDQREVGLHAVTFEDGVRSAMREAPELIVVGDVQDPPTVEAVLSAAEQGITVLGVIPAMTVARALHGMLEAYDPAREKRARQRLQSVVRAVVLQRFEVHNGRRVAVPEVVVGIGSVLN